MSVLHPPRLTAVLAAAVALAGLASCGDDAVTATTTPIRPTMTIDERDDHASRYDTAVQVPVLSGLATADADTRANSVMRQNLDEVVRSWTTEMTSDDLTLSTDTEAMKPTMEVTSSLRDAIDGYVAVRCEIYSYSGGAHPSTQVMGWVFRTADGSTVKLLDLAQGTGAQERIVAAAKAAVLAQLPDDDPTMMDGAGPVDGDWRAWSPERDGVHIAYSDYDVGPYAIGRPEVVIGWDVITGGASSPVTSGSSAPETPAR